MVVPIRLANSTVEAELRGLPDCDELMDAPVVESARVRCAGLGIRDWQSCCRDHHTRGRAKLPSLSGGAGRFYAAAVNSANAGARSAASSGRTTRATSTPSRRKRSEE